MKNCYLETTNCLMEDSENEYIFEVQVQVNFKKLLNTFSRFILIFRLLVPSLSAGNISKHFGSSRNKGIFCSTLILPAPIFSRFPATPGKNIPPSCWTCEALSMEWTDIIQKSNARKEVIAKVAQKLAENGRHQAGVTHFLVNIYKFHTWKS